MPSQSLRAVFISGMYQTRQSRVCLKVQKGVKKCAAKAREEVIDRAITDEEGDERENDWRGRCVDGWDGGNIYGSKEVKCDIVGGINEFIDLHGESFRIRTMRVQ